MLAQPVDASHRHVLGQMVLLVVGRFDGGRVLDQPRFPLRRFAREEAEMEGSVEAAGRLENIGEMIGSAREFTRVDEFLEQVALVADTDELDDDDKVVLMTLHSAKGLEYPVVFLVGMEEGLRRGSYASFRLSRPSTG